MSLGWLLRARRREAVGKAVARSFRWRWRCRCRRLWVDSAGMEVVVSLSLVWVLMPVWIRSRLESRLLAEWTDLVRLAV